MVLYRKEVVSSVRYMHPPCASSHLPTARKAADEAGAAQTVVIIE